MAIGQFDACVVNYDLDTNYQIGHRSYKRDNFLAKCHSAVINYNHKVRQEKTDQISINSGMSATSVTRLGDLLDFGHFLKPLAAINLPKSPTFLSNFFVQVSKSIIFLVKSFLGNFYRHLAIFSGHTVCHPALLRWQ